MSLLAHHDDILDASKAGPARIEVVSGNVERWVERQGLVMAQLEVAQLVERMVGCAGNVLGQHRQCPRPLGLFLPRI